MAKKKVDSADQQDEVTESAIDQMKTLPRVEAVQTLLQVHHHEKPERAELPKGNIGFVLKPFTPKPRKSMVTMSDLGTDAQPMGGDAARRPKKA